MARQQSNSELAGNLGATLTPRAPRGSAQPPRAAQNSGLFDMSALYAEAAGQVMHRARSDGRLMPLARAAQPAWPLPTQWPQPVLSYDLEDDVPIEFTEGFVGPRSRGLGWFGVAVAWLATVTTGALIATSLPGHARTHSRSAVLGAAVVVTPASPQAPSPPAVTPASPVVLAVPAVAAPPAVASPPPAVSVMAPPASPVVSTKKIAPRVASPAVAHVQPASAIAVTAAPVANAPAAHGPLPAKASTTSPAAVSTVGMSLDELIRHEVQVESAKHK